MTDIALSVIIPTYNEAANIERLVEEVLTVIRLALAPRFLEVIVVDDFSPDGTFHIAVNIKDRDVGVLCRTSDRGLRKSIEDGINAAQGDIVLWMDGDGSHPPRYIPQLVKAVSDGFDIAVNSRYVVGGEDVREGKGTLLQRALSRMLNTAIRFLLGHQFRDYTSGFCAARKEVVRELGLRGDYGEYFIDFIYRATRSGKRIVELPFRNEPRRGGTSKTGSGLADYARRGLGYLGMAVKTRFGRE